ncbi:MAG: hypothetical protein ACYTAF_15560, partial [Planctomycetota bacterium]
MTRLALLTASAALALASTGCIAQIHYALTPLDSEPSAEPSECHLGGAFEDLVGVGVSGGGSRAAVFAAAGLEALWEHGVIENVTHLSSVSGGSIAASYFVANRPTCEEAASEAEREDC